MATCCVSNFPSSSSHNNEENSSQILVKRSRTFLPSEKMVGDRDQRRQSTSYFRMNLTSEIELEMRVGGIESDSFDADADGDYDMVDIDGGGHIDITDDVEIFAATSDNSRHRIEVEVDDGVHSTNSVTIRELFHGRSVDW